MTYPNKARHKEENPNWIDGASAHPLNKIWRAMINRCTNPENRNWLDYGGRGISVHPPWLESFWQFLADVGERPEGNYPSGRALYELDRIDNDGNYEPNNVRWATRTEQLLNRRYIEPTHCPQGHDLNEVGFREPNRRGRKCRTCKREQAAAYARRHRAHLKDSK